MDFSASDASEFWSDHPPFGLDHPFVADVNLTPSFQQARHAPAFQEPPLVELAEDDSPLPFSIIAEGTVNINGKSDFDGDPLTPRDDALIYGGDGFTLNGRQTLPVQRDETGTPIQNDSGKSILVENAVAVSENYRFANAHAASRQYSGLLPPKIVEAQTVEVPVYGDLKQEQIQRRQPSPTLVFDVRQNRVNNFKQWEQKFPSGGTQKPPYRFKLSMEDSIFLHG